MDTNVPHMLLSLFVDSSDNQLLDAYQEAVASHNAKWATQEGMMDAGFDLLCPADIRCTNMNVNKVDYQVACRAQLMLGDGKKVNTGFYLYPRSSLSKTQLRLANSVGIVDAGYRGHLIGMFDMVCHPNADPFMCSNEPILRKLERQLQICAPSLFPIYVTMVNSKEELGEVTARGEGGFGSTGK